MDRKWRRQQPNMAKVGRECGRVLLGLAEVRNNLKRLRTLKSASLLSSERMVGDSEVIPISGYFRVLHGSATHLHE